MSINNTTPHSFEHFLDDENMKAWLLHEAQLTQESLLWLEQDTNTNIYNDVIQKGHGNSLNDSMEVANVLACAAFMRDSQSEAGIEDFRTYNMIRSIYTALFTGALKPSDISGNLLLIGSGTTMAEVNALTEIVRITDLSRYISEAKSALSKDLKFNPQSNLRWLVRTEARASTSGREIMVIEPHAENFASLIYRTMQRHPEVKCEITGIWEFLKRNPRNTYSSIFAVRTDPVIWSGAFINPIEIGSCKQDLLRYLIRIENDISPHIRALYPALPPDGAIYMSVGTGNGKPGAIARGYFDRFMRDYLGDSGWDIAQQRELRTERDEIEAEIANMVARKKPRGNNRAS